MDAGSQSGMTEFQDDIRMTRFALTIEYDGRPFMGWQRQAHGPSVQQTIEEAIHRFTAEDRFRCSAPGAPTPASMRSRCARMSTSKSR